MLKKLSVVLFALMLLLSAAPILAADDTPIPEFNPLCWKKDDCTKARAQFGQAGDDGFLPDQYPCIGGNPPWGKCLPSNQTVTEISFGGTKKFTDLGDFLVRNYRLAVGAAAILAAIVVVMGGFQWATSAGNPEAINSAKKRITSALTGMVIAYFSYFILSTINPNLVNLKLPTAMMLRPINAVPKFCSAASSSMFAWAADSKAAEQEKPVTLPKQISYDQRYTDDNKATFFCGKRFFVQNSGSMTCFGDYCPAGQVCAQDLQTNSGPYMCQPGNVIGLVYNSNPMSGEVTGQLSRIVSGMAIWDNPPLRAAGIQAGLNQFELSVVCNQESARWANNNRVANVDVNDLPGSKQSIKVSVDDGSLDAAASDCSDLGGLKGFALNLGFNSLTKLCFLRRDFAHTAEQHMIGRDGIDLGDTAYFFYKYGTLIPSQYFYSADEIKKGVSLTIDAANVHSFYCDTNEDSPARMQSYGYLIGK